MHLESASSAAISAVTAAVEVDVTGAAKSKALLERVGLATVVRAIREFFPYGPHTLLISLPR